MSAALAGRVSNSSSSTRTAASGMMTVTCRERPLLRPWPAVTCSSACWIAALTAARSDRLVALTPGAATPHAQWNEGGADILRFAGDGDVPGRRSEHAVGHDLNGETRAMGVSVGGEDAADDAQGFFLMLKAAYLPDSMNVTLLISFSVVKPRFTRSSAESRRKSMPSAAASLRTSEAGFLSRIISRMGSVRSSSSWMAVRATEAGAAALDTTDAFAELEVAPFVGGEAAHDERLLVDVNGLRAELADGTGRDAGARMQLSAETKL